MDYLTALAISKLTRTDPPRKNEARVKVRIQTMADSVVVAGVCLNVPEDATKEKLSAHLVAREIVAEFYEEDLPELMGLVEPLLGKTEIEAVESNLEADLAEWAEPILKGREDKEKARLDAERSFPGSFAAQWRKVFKAQKRDLKPFVSVTRIEEKTKKAA